MDTEKSTFATRPLLVFVVFFLLMMNLSAQVHLSLKECIAIGLENNYSILISQNNQRVFNNNVTLGNAGFLPRITLSGQHSGVVNNTRQNLFDGTTTSSSGVHNVFNNASISLNQTIFDGFRVQNTYKRLKEVSQVSELQTRFSMENTVSRIVSEYYYLILQERLLENMKYAVELSKERTRIDEERYLIGAGSKLQLLQSQAYLNADSSRLGRQYEVVRASRIKLNTLLALDDTTELVHTNDTLIGIKPDLLYDQLLQNTLSDNTALLISSRNRVISEIDSKIIASRAYPYLNFSAGYGLSYNTYQSGSIANQRNLSPSYGLTLGFAIFDGFNRKREMSNARIEIENRQLMLQQLEHEIRADLLTIYNGYANNMRLIELEKQNLEVARENLEIALERYKLGALSGIELREVQKTFFEAEERLLSIQYQTKLAEISLLHISGNIMDYL
jgi:outer membrane protein TolC